MVRRRIRVGSVVSADDQGVVDLIEQGDVINSVTLSGDFEPLLDRVEQVAGGIKY